MGGILIAGTHSGVGKTTFCLGIMAALKRRGLSVQPFKVGPDFIDPSHHRWVSGLPSRNLDGWMFSKGQNQSFYGRFSAKADVAVVEGVMGLFDGHGDDAGAGSSAQMAKWLGVPVLLVLDAKGMAQSGAAVVLGYQKYDPELSLAGVLLNRVGSERHAAMLREAIHAATGLPVLGVLPLDQAIAIQERHLGLVPAEEDPHQVDWLPRLIERVEEGVAIDRLIDLAERHATPVYGLAVSEGWGLSATGVQEGSVPEVRIGVARDEAFHFYYPENLEALEAAGGELVYFSPLEDPHLPEGLCGLYLGGGYPEMFAERLEKNEGLRSEIKKAVDAGLPTYAECGGLIYLAESMESLEGCAYAMVGAIAAQARMLPRRKALGYREVRLQADTLIGTKGTVLRGHEFHYSELLSEPPGLTRVYAVSSRRHGTTREEGYQRDGLLASYIHLRLDTARDAAKCFVQAARNYRGTP